MLNETASSRDDRPPVRRPAIEESAEDALADAMRQVVAEVMEIDSMTTASDSDTNAQDVPLMLRALGGDQVTARFVGRLRLNSEAAYDKLDMAFRKINHTPLLREENGRHIIIALAGRAEPQPRPWWPNLLLFLATLVSVLMVGAQLAISNIARENPALARELANNFEREIWRGWPYAASLLLILGAHELGHYFAARRHNLAVTLPYFIPLPFISLFGTLGAFIQLRQPMRNRKVLFDVGAAGPLAGLVFAVPILFIGLAQAHVGPVSGEGLYEGDSLLYAFAKIVTFGEFLPSNGRDVYIDSSQMAWAGWTGLLVSALNLIPIGQLDGGHIMYSLIGERARLLYYPLLAVMIALVFVTQVWLLWVVLLLLFGRVYATPLDTVTTLDSRRRWLAVGTLLIFLCIFVPAPLSPTSSGDPAPRAPRRSVQTMPETPEMIRFTVGQ